MRTVRRIGVGLASVVALAVVGLLVGPSLVDWNSLKRDISLWVGTALGRTVVLEGNISLSLLPHPTLSVAQVYVESPHSGQPHLLDLEQLDLQVAFWPLLGGRIEVQTLALHQPHLTLALQDDGTGPWEPGLGLDVRLDRVQIHNGVISLQDADRGVREQISGINLSLTAESLLGPFQVSGEALVKTLPVQFDVGGGRFDPAAGLPLRATVTSPGTRIIMDGLAARETNGSPTFHGRMALDVEALMTLLDRVLPAPVQGLPAPLRQATALRATVEAGAGQINLSDLEVRAGALTVNGKAKVLWGGQPTVSLALSARNLALDPWIDFGPAPVLGRPGRAGLADAASEPEASNDGGQPALNLLGGVSPGGVSIAATVTAETLNWRGQSLQQVQAEAHLAGGILTLDRITARGPGGAALGLSGTLVTPGGEPALDLRLTASADDLHPMLEGFGFTGNTIPADRLRRFTLTTRLQKQGDTVTVSGLDTRLDGSHAEGQLSWHGDSLSRLQARFEVDRLDLDPWWAARLDQATLAGAPERLVAVPDGQLFVSVKELIAGGVPLKGVVIEGAVQNGHLSLTQARVADLAGMSGSVKGEIARIKPLSGVALSFALQSGSLAGVERLPGTALPSLLTRLVPAKLEGQVRGGAERLTFETSLDSNGGAISASGVVVPGSGAITEPVRLHLDFPRTSQLLALLLADADTRMLSSGESSGPTVMTLLLAGTPQDGFSLTAEPGTFAGTSLRGQGTIALSGARPAVQLHIQAGDLNLDRLLPSTGTPAAPPGARQGARPSPASGRTVARSAALSRGGAPAPGRWSTVPFDLGILNRVDLRLSLDATSLTTNELRFGGPVVNLHLQNGTLVITQADAELGGGQVKATGSLVASAGAAPSFSASATLGQLQLTRIGGLGSPPLSISAGMVEADVKISGRGTNQATMVESLAGNGSMRILDGRISGMGLAQVAEKLGRLSRPQDVIDLLTQNVSQGDTPFGRLEGTFTINRGVVTTRDVHLTAPLIQGEAVASAALVPYTIDATAKIRLRPDQSLPPLLVTLSGPLDDPERRIDTREVQAYLVQRVGSKVLEKVVPGLKLGPGIGGGAPLDRPADAVKGLFDRFRR